jgi:hypothetical protein
VHLVGFITRRGGGGTQKKMQAFYLIKYVCHTALLKHNKPKLCHTFYYKERGRGNPKENAGLLSY